MLLREITAPDDKQSSTTALLLILMRSSLTSTQVAHIITTPTTGVTVPKLTIAWLVKKIPHVYSTSSLTIVITKYRH
jgi:hypothetical protein